MTTTTPEVVGVHAVTEDGGLLILTITQDGDWEATVAQYVALLTKFIVLYDDGTHDVMPSSWGGITHLAPGDHIHVTLNKP